MIKMYVRKCKYTRLRFIFQVIMLATLVMFDLSTVTSQIIPYISMNASSTPRNLIATESESLTVYMDTHFVKTVELFIGKMLTLNIICPVNDLPKDDEITKVEFCWSYRNAPDASEKCTWVSPSRPEISGGIDSYGLVRKIPFKINFLQKRGGSVIFADIQSDEQFKGDHDAWYCKIHNRQGILVSREIHFIDNRYGTYQFLLDSEKEMFFETTHPLVLHCLRSKRITQYKVEYGAESLSYSKRLKFFPEFRWDVCNDSSFKDCKDILELSDNNWTISIHPDYGSLFLSYVPEEDQSKLKDKWFKCSVQNYDIRRYSQPLKFGQGFQEKTLNFDKYFDMYSSANRAENFRWYELLHRQSKDFKLTVYDHCHTKFTPAIPIIGWTKETTVTWLLDGKSISPLKNDEDSHGKCFLVDYTNFPVCRGPFRRQTSVKLIVKKFNLEIRHTIHLIPDSIIGHSDDVPAGQNISEPTEIVGVEGSDVEFECRYRDNIYWENQKKKSNRYFFIRGLMIFKSDTARKKINNYKKEIKRLNEDFSEVMAPIDMDLHLLNDEILKVKVKNVIYRSNKGLSNNFYALCGDGTNVFAKRGRLYSQYFIYFWAIPRPKAEKIEKKEINETEFFTLRISDENAIRNISPTRVDCSWKMNNETITGTSITPQERKQFSNQCILKLELSDDESGNRGKLEVNAKLVNTKLDKKHDNYVIFNFPTVYFRE